MNKPVQFLFALVLALGALLPVALAPGDAAAQSSSAPACERPHPPSQCKLPTPPAPTQSEFDR